MSKRFRELQKEDLGGRVPVALASEVRKLAAANHRSISIVNTEALARLLGIDPARFGIEPIPTNQDSRS